MLDYNPELVVILMFGGLLLLCLSGYPLAFSILIVAGIVGFLFMGSPVFYLFRSAIYGFLSSYILIAIPLFIFMGTILEHSKIASKLYDSLYLFVGGINGGLAVATVLLGVILAACVGVIAASIAMIGTIAVPEMLKRGYQKELVLGTTGASGSLGILIPPSIMLVMYGPAASISVGKLFAGAIVPGLLLGGSYIVYILITCRIRPALAPSLASAERKSVPIKKKFYLLLTSAVPPVVIILTVLGTIYFGIASPTEAAALGCVGAFILALISKGFSLKVLKKCISSTTITTATALVIALMSVCFTGVLLRLGGGETIRDLIMLMPGEKWGIFWLIQLIVFILGMFVDWIGILYIVIPVITPIVIELGYDPVWFALIICLNFQTSLLTPPLAPAIYFMKAIAKPAWGVTTAHMIRGIIPFTVIIVLVIGLCMLFPDLILWLPNNMVRTGW